MDDRGHTGDLTIAIIGAGFSGLTAAYYIRKQTNLQSFVIYEKSGRTDGGAGTWKDNTYPGCACDVPIHLYQLSWAKRMTWTEYLPLQPEIQNYLNDITHTSGLYRHIQFGTELVEARWLEDEGKWALTLRNVEAENPEDAVYTVKHHVVIFATGPLSQPRMPDGFDTKIFKGEQFHSQHWRHDIALENKRVAVVGNGCSASQFMPIIARRTKSLTQYISSPQWYVPRDNPLYTESQIARFKYIPFYEQSYRLRLAYAWENEAFKLKGGAGPAKTRSKIEGYFLSHLKATAPEKYVKQLTPQFPLGCKRLVFDSNYLQSLHNENVDLAFTRVQNVYENGLIGTDGSRREFDIVIWATGFTATMPFEDTKVYGRSGKELHDRWTAEGAPTAYAGMQYPDLPNFYTMTGPNTLSGHFSLTMIIEIQAQYIAQLLGMQLNEKIKSFEVTEAAHEEYNSWIQDLMKGRVWTSPLCNSWFKTKNGLVPTNFPGTTMLYWSKVYYPNMSHQRQVGGKRKVYGTSIPKELGKLSWKVAALVAVTWALRANSAQVVRSIHSVRNWVSTTLWTLMRQGGLKAVSGQ